MEKTFQTGSFSFRLRFPEELVLPADMEKFAVEKESADYTYTITIVDTLPEAEGELLVNRVDLQVFRNGEGLESRLITGTSPVGAAMPDSALCIPGVSGEGHALFSTIWNGQNYAGGPLGAVPGKPYCKR